MFINEIVNITSRFIINNTRFELTRFSQSRRKSDRQRKSNCKMELEGIQLEVAEDDKELLLLPAMEGNGLEDVFKDLDGAWGVPENEKTILSTRTNQLPD